MNNEYQNQQYQSSQGSPQETPSARIQRLQDKHDIAKDNLYRLRARRDSVMTQLQGLEADAIAHFGTSSISELRNIYRNNQASNAALMDEWEASLDDAAKLIAEIENQLNLPSPGDNKGYVGS